MIQLRYYKEGDYESIQAVEPELVKGDFSEIIDKGVYFTAVDDDKPIGCGGIIFTGEDSGEVWLTLSESFVKKPVLFIRILEAGYALLKDSLEIKKITAKVNAKFNKGCRLIRHFGFNKVREETINGVQYGIYERWLTPLR